MTPDILFQFVLLGVAVVLFVSNRVRPDAVAVGLILALILSGQLTAVEALSGFGNSLVLMIAGLFIVGEGLSRTGIAHMLGDWLMRHAGGSEKGLVVRLMAVVAVLSAFMSSTGAVAVFIPVTLTLARRTGVAASRLLLPVANASLFGGMLTLIGTPPNLAVSGELAGFTGQGFKFFDFTPVGLAVLVAGMGWIVFVGRHRLAGHAEDRPDRSPTFAELADRYGTLGTGRSLRLGPASRAAGRTPADLGLAGDLGVILIGVQRQGRFSREVLRPSADLALRAGDLLHVVGEEAAVERLAREHDLVPSGKPLDHREVLLRDVGLAEVLVPPRSVFAGATLRDADLRARTGLSVLAVQRREEALENIGAGTKLAAGDTVLLTGDWRAIRALGGKPRELVPLSLPREMADVAPARSRAPVCLAILLVMLLLMTFDVIPAVAAVLLAALAMVAGGCVSAARVYRCIGWPSIVLIAGMLPLATALENSGAITLIVDGVVGSLGELGPRAVLAGLFLLTAAFSQFISNTATAVLVAPVAVLVAAEMGISPKPLLMAVALAASAAFLTPVASPVNTLVMGAGGYRFGDFFRTGLPLVLITLTAAILVVPLLFPFR